MEQMRYRAAQIQSAQIVEGAKGAVLAGTAIPYEVWSKEFRENGRRVIERIRSGAFDQDISSGKRIDALIEHDPKKFLGSTQSGTLRLRSANGGVEFEIDLPATSYANDLRELNKRGEFNFCSFGYHPTENGETWRKRSDGTWECEVTRGALNEITITRTPIYPAGTKASLLRSVDAAIRRERAEQSRRLFCFFTLRHPPRS